MNWPLSAAYEVGREGGQEKCGSETLEGSEQVCSVSGQSELQLKHLNPGQERPGERRGNWREPGEGDGERRLCVCTWRSERTMKTAGCVP